MSRSSALLSLLLLACAVPAADAATGAAARETLTAAAAGPAEWRSFDLLVDLESLPRPYTCTELWYRLRDLLLAIGARPDLRIVPCHCGPTRAESSRSPSVELQFRLPRALPAADARYADVPVVRATVRLAPGTLRSFTEEDCELLRQLATLLLPALPVHPLGAGLSCPAPGAARYSFALEVQALMPRS